MTVSVVQDVGDPAAHAGGKIAAGGSQHHHPAAGHILAAVVADPFHHGHGSAVSYAEALAGPAADVSPARRGAV